MKLLLRRNQKSSMLGGSITFVLIARAELTSTEADNVKKYKMGKTLLFSNFEDKGEGMVRTFSRLVTSIKVTVDDLVHGKEIDCKDIVEMIGIEEQIKEACRTFKVVLDTAARFGGEEVIEY